MRYEAEFDLAAGSNRCNCSLCTKARAWFLFVGGDKFKLLAGDDVLSDYQWLPPAGQSPASPIASAHDAASAYATGQWAQMGGRFYAIHVPTLDDVDVEQLVRGPLNFIDNRHDRTDRAPADTRLM